MALSSNLFLQPCKPDDFYGFRETINNFVEKINGFKKKENNIHSYIILGDEGTGKSSLLNKLPTMIQGRRDITHLFTLSPEESELVVFFKNMKNIMKTAVSRLFT